MIALLEVGAHEAVIERVDRALALGDRGPGFEPDDVPWLLNKRSNAHVRLGQIDLAKDDLRRAAALGDRGGANVNQMLNLAVLHCELGEPAEIRKVVAAVAPDLSEYGKSVLDQALLCAAHLSGDDAHARSLLAKLEARLPVGTMVHLEALLMLGDLDEAATAYIAMFDEPDHVADALLLAQQGLKSPELPGERDLSRNRQAMLARPDVTLALAKIGRSERYALYL